MKANELMIGDWVLVSNTPLKIAALGTIKAGFFDYDDKGELFYHYYDNIEPLQLHDNLLDKNGFNRGEYTAADYFRKEAHHVVYSLLLDNGRQVVTLDYYDGLIELEVAHNGRSVWFKNLRYVHELQHAIRLCGIEKQIMTTILNN